MLMLQVHCPKYKYSGERKTKRSRTSHENSTPSTGRNPACLHHNEIRVLPRRESAKRLRPDSRRCGGAYRAFLIAATTSNTVMYGDDVVGVTTISSALRSGGRSSTNEDVNWSMAGLGNDLSLNML